MAQRGTTDLSFVLGVNKPSGMSSHDVVNRVRTLFGERRVGHFGTLDPLASGVLVLGVGPAARLDAYLTSHDKTYVARIVFGEERNTDDAEGEVIAYADVPECVSDAQFASSILSACTGSLEQVPPAFSAIKRNGHTSYELARKGQIVDLEPRAVTVYSAELLSCDTSSWTVSFTVSGGTYIRALARDIGHAVGCGAYLASLERTMLGDVSLAQCQTLDDIDAANPHILDPISLLGFPCIEVPASLASALNNGGELPLICLGTQLEPSCALEDGDFVSIILDNTLKGIYRLDLTRNAYVCACLFRIGVARG